MRWDLEVQYEQMPKYKQIVEILEKLENDFKKSDLYKDVYQPYTFKKLKETKKKKSSKKFTGDPVDLEARVQKEVDKISKEKKDVEEFKDKQMLFHERREINKNVAVLVKNYKQYIDLIRFLYQFFVKKDNGLGFYDDRLRLHLNSYRESKRRDASLDIDNPLYNNEKNTGLLGSK